MSYMPKAERQRRREEAKARGVGNDTSKTSRATFWAGMLMGAATATGGFFAIRALEKAFSRKRAEEAGTPALNPAPDEARARLLAAATGTPQLAAPAPKAAVTKRTIIEEMVEDLDT